MIPLTLNWFGVAVHDVSTATNFYGTTLGMSFRREKPGEALWRYFETRGMTFELFHAHPARISVNGWGHGQAFRPVILVGDLAAEADALRQRRIPVSDAGSGIGARIEMTGPEGIRWGLAQAPQSETDWSHPLIGGVELKAVHLEAQKAFYTHVLGMAVEREMEQTIHLSQPDGEAWLHIENGGLEMPIPAPPGDPKPAFYYPIWISYETQDVRSADIWLQRQGVRILHPLTYNQDWDGTDIIIADADGNAIQIVQYGKADGI